jgi:hypothetical protein
MSPIESLARSRLASQSSPRITAKLCVISTRVIGSFGLVTIESFIKSWGKKCGCTAWVTAGMSTRSRYLVYVGLLNFQWLPPTRPPAAAEATAEMGLSRTVTVELLLMRALAMWPAERELRVSGNE